MGVGVGVGLHRQHHQRQVSSVKKHEFTYYVLRTTYNKLVPIHHSFSLVPDISFTSHLGWSCRSIMTLVNKHVQLRDFINLTTEIGCLLFGTCIKYVHLTIFHLCTFKFICGRFVVFRKRLKTQLQPYTHWEAARIVCCICWRW